MKEGGVPQMLCERAFQALAPADAKRLTRRQLLDAVHFLGLNPTKRVVREFCSSAGRSSSRSGGNSKKKDADHAAAVTTAADDAIYTLDDLIDLANQVSPTTVEGLRGAFRLVDADGNGKLTRSELDAVLARGGERMTRAELDEVMAQFDADGDGQIDFEEFTSMMMAFSDQMRSMRPPPLVRSKDAAASGGGTSNSGFGGGGGKEKNKNKPHNSSKRRSKSKMVGRGGGGGGGGGDVADVLAVAVQEGRPEREPNGLRAWDCDRLGGTVQALTAAATVAAAAKPPPLPRLETPEFRFSLDEPSEIYITLRLDRSGYHRAMDVALLLLRQAEEDDRGSALVGASPSQWAKDPALRIHLEAGDYTVVPFISGARLRPRASQPRLPPVKLCRPTANGWEPTQACVTALTQVFHRLDADGRGSISRDEYSYLQRKTDGEECDDATWEYVSDNFSMEDDGLTLEGFLEMYTQFAASCEGDDTKFYPTFECLGFNHKLEVRYGGRSKLKAEGGGILRRGGGRVWG